MKKLAIALVLFFTLLTSCKVGEESQDTYPSYRFIVRTYTHSNLMVSGPFKADSVFIMTDNRLKLHKDGDSTILDIPQGVRVRVTDQWK